MSLFAQSWPLQRPRAATFFSSKRFIKELLRVLREECEDPANTIWSLPAVGIVFTRTASQTHSHTLFSSFLCFWNYFFFLWLECTNEGSNGSVDETGRSRSVVQPWLRLGERPRWPAVNMIEYLSLSVSLVHKINRRLLDLLYPQQLFLYCICFCSLKFPQTSSVPLTKLTRRLAQSYTDLLIVSILFLKTNQLSMTLSVFEGASARFLESFFFCPWLLFHPIRILLYICISSSSVNIHLGCMFSTTVAPRSCLPASIFTPRLTAVQTCVWRCVATEWRPNVLLRRQKLQK